MDNNPVILSRAQYKTLIDRIEELEAQIDELPDEDDVSDLRYTIKELEAKLQRVEEVRYHLATQCNNHRVYSARPVFIWHAVKMLNKALKEKDDG
jgi:BMFP domain-containing protein YqiC